MRGIKAHVGHVDGFGIQGHSCGPLFPWSVLGVGNALCGFNGSTGEQLPLHPFDFKVDGSHSNAYDAVEHDIRLRILLEEIAKELPVKLNINRAFDQINELRRVKTLKLAA